MKRREPVESAVAHFADGYLCSQALLLAYAARFGIEPRVAARIAAPFGAGMGRMGWTCGAVTGALMVIGLRYGHEGAEDVETKERMYGVEQKFLSLFRELHGSVQCQELLGLDLSTEEGLESARTQGMFEKLCPKYVEDAAAILEEILEGS